MTHLVGAPSLLVVATVAPTIRGFLRPYAVHLRSQGWRVEAAANGAAGDPALVEAFDRVHELPLSRSIMDLGGMLRTMGELSRIISTGFDIVHVHTPIAGMVTRTAIRRMPRARRPAVVYTAHGFHFHPGGSRLQNAIFLTAEKIAGRWTDRLVVINDTDNESAIRHHIVPRRRLRLMPGIGLDTRWYARSSVAPDAIEAARAGLGVAPDAPLFVDVGELTMRKRPWDVIAALGRMRHTESQLALVGDGPERARVEAAIDAAGVRERVHLAGIVADVRPVVAAAAALVLASSMEGLPRSIMEALSLEVPVVASDARGNPDLVLPGAGMVVPVGDVAALAAAMDRILDDPAGARAMGERGRARIVERYDLPILIEHHEELYRELLAERAG